MLPPEGVHVGREDGVLRPEGAPPPEGVQAGREDGVVPPEGVRAGRGDGEEREAPEDPVGSLNPPNPCFFFFFPGGFFPGGGCWLP